MISIAGQNAPIIQADNQILITNATASNDLSWNCTSSNELFATAFKCSYLSQLLTTNQLLLKQIIYHWPTIIAVNMSYSLYDQHPNYDCNSYNYS